MYFPSSWFPNERLLYLHPDSHCTQWCCCYQGYSRQGQGNCRINTQEHSWQLKATQACCGARAASETGLPNSLELNILQRDCHHNTGLNLSKTSHLISRRVGGDASVLWWPEARMSRFFLAYLQLPGLVGSCGLLISTTCCCTPAWFNLHTHCHQPHL